MSGAVSRFTPFDFLCCQNPVLGQGVLNHIENISEQAGVTEGLLQPLLAPGVFLYLSCFSTPFLNPTHFHTPSETEKRLSI